MGFEGLYEQHTTVDLVLDPQIRNFVLIPILLVVLAKAFLQTNLTQWMQKPPKAPEQKKLTHHNLLARSARLRGNNNWIPEDVTLFSLKKFLQYCLRNTFFFLFRFWALTSSF